MKEELTPRYWNKECCTIKQIPVPKAMHRDCFALVKRKEWRGGKKPTWKRTEVDICNNSCNWQKSTLFWLCFHSIMGENLSRSKTLSACNKFNISSFLGTHGRTENMLKFKPWGTGQRGHCDCVWIQERKYLRNLNS